MCCPSLQTDLPQPRDMEGAGWQDLDDEAYGLIWASAGCGQDRRSMRLASRAVALSPAVNAQIQACTVQLLEGPEGAEAALDQLLRFPRAATLRRLRLRGPIIPCTERSSCVGHFMQAVQGSAQARAQLSGLMEIHFQVRSGTGMWS